MQSKSEMKIVRLIFGWMGLSPALSQIRSNSAVYNILTFLPITVQLIFLLLELNMLIKYHEKYSGEFSSAISYIDLLQFIVVFIAGLFQILENFFKCSSDQHIENSIVEIDTYISARHLCEAQSLCSLCQTQNIKWHLIIRGVCIVLVSLLLDIATVATIKLETWRECQLICLTTVTMLRIGIVQVLCYFCWVSIQCNHTLIIKCLYLIQFPCS